MLEKITGCLLGGAIGDSLGMPVEGWHSKRIQKHCGRIESLRDPVMIYEKGELQTSDKWGKIGYWTKDLKKGEYTDDTILTLAILDSITMYQGINIHSIADSHVDAYKNHNNKESGFGRATKLAINSLMAGACPLTTGVCSLGTGPAMKMAPVGLWHGVVQGENAKESLSRDSVLIGEMTHHDHRSVICGSLQAYVIYLLLTDPSITKEDLIEEIFRYSITHENFKLHKCCDITKDFITKKIVWIAKNHSKSVENAHKHFGSGSLSTQAYPFVLFCVLKYWDNPIEGMIDIVNWGGDCDTTGAMFGNILGARHGVFCKSEWLEALVKREEIEQKAAKFLARALAWK